MSEHRRRTERAYHILGVPFRSGSLYPGSENDAEAYRGARLLERLRAVGCNVVDDGDVAIPSYLPHHAIPPIRSWPGPGSPGTVSASASSPAFDSRGTLRS